MKTLWIVLAGIAVLAIPILLLMLYDHAGSMYGTDEFAAHFERACYGCPHHGQRSAT